MARHPLGHTQLAHHPAALTALLALALDSAARGDVLALFVLLVEGTGQEADGGAAPLVQTLTGAQCQELVRLTLLQLVRAQDEAGPLLDLLAALALVPAMLPALLAHQLPQVLAQLLRPLPPPPAALLERALETCSALARHPEGASRLREDGITELLLTLLKRLHPLPVGGEEGEAEEGTVPPVPPSSPCERVRLLEGVLSSLIPLALSGSVRLEVARDPLAVLVLADLLNTHPEQDPTLLHSIVLAERLAHHRPLRLQLLRQGVLVRLFTLLAASSSQPLTAQLVALVAALMSDLEEGEAEGDAAHQAVAEHGLMPLTALLSNSNDYILVRTLLLLLALTHVDSLRDPLRRYLDPDQLQGLALAPSPATRQLAATLRHALAL